MKRLTKFLGLTALSALAACGGSDGDGNPIGSNDPIALLCGFTCPGGTVDGTKLPGVADGNASISGVASVDAFFSAVLGFETAAGGVSDGIQAQLDAIRADFGIEGDLAAGLKSQFDANLQADLAFDYQPARCAVDAQATLEASAKCDASVMGGKAVVECKGSCAVEASAEASCDANAELYCTVSGPELDCKGECQGSCTAELMGAAKCDGTCQGSCDGDCSAYVKNADGELVCNGTCSGMCTGSCEAQLSGSAMCEGTCRGECTAKAPSAGCEGAVHAECRAMANASFMCEGSCRGEFEPPKVSAECEASAKAQASVNVQCTPPRMDVTYALKADASAKFKGALTALIDVRLPALMQAVGKAKVVARAGEDLGVAANGAVKGAVDQLQAKVQLKLLYGLKCAAAELPKAEKIVTDSAATLNAKLTESQQIASMLGIDV